MTAITANWHFDILEFVKMAKENGVNEKFAEYQARQMEVLSEVVQEQRSKISVLESKNPATKGDLEITKLELQKEIEIVRKDIEIIRKEIAEVKSNLIWWILGTGATTIFAIAGLLKFSLH